MKMVDIDQDRMQQVAQESFDKVSGNRRWQTAIAKAKAQLETNPYMHFEGETLLILSPSGEIYTANGTCQCKAFKSGQPCWHRAAARLVNRYNETSH
ncbi:MAG TPA: SWIM zinc finger family protein [Pyrinomonadaceae bacterium]|nr:SWIM zinc finger family protein [Pyrinomonadaceae bacterium]